MFPINPIGTTQTARTTEKKKKPVSSSGIFAGILSHAEAADEAQAPAPTAPTAPLSSTNPMLAWQEIGDDEMERRQAVRHGRLTLDALDELRHAMLMGALPVRLLREMEALVTEQRRYRPDPQLSAILDEIELRAAVELAKVEVASNSRK